MTVEWHPEVPDALGMQLWHLEEKDVGETALLSLLENDRSKFLHIVRSSLRQEQWSEVAYRRPEFYEVRNGIDRAATVSLYSKLNGLDRYRLRCIHTGAVQTNSRLARNRKSNIDPTCQCCGRAPETVKHLFAECPAHAVAREENLKKEYFEALPDCTKLAGIIPQTLAQPEDVSKGAAGRRELAAELQYTLLSILQSRNRILGDQVQVQPRWGN